MKGNQNGDCDTMLPEMETICVFDSETATSFGDVAKQCDETEAI